MKLTASVALALFFLPSVAVAQENEEAPWSVALLSGWIFMGALRPTGGVMPTLECGRVVPIGGLRTSLGASLGLFGFGNAARWLGALGGPYVAITGRMVSAPVQLHLAAHADFGRLPTCNNWGLCLNYAGFFPAASAEVAYARSNAVSIGASVSIRYVSTYGWSGASVAPALAARFHW